MGYRVLRAAAMAICLVAAGCSGGSTASSEGARASYAVEPDGNKLILSVYEYGGMTWSYYLYWWSHEPEFSLCGDGRVIVSCSPDVSKPPVLPCVNETHVSPDEIQRIIAAADKTGLLADGTYDADSVTDQTTTVFETTVGGYQHKVQAYALEKSASKQGQVDRGRTAGAHGLSGQPRETG